MPGSICYFLLNLTLDLDTFGMHSKVLFTFGNYVLLGLLEYGIPCVVSIKSEVNTVREPV